MSDEQDKPTLLDRLGLEELDMRDFSRECPTVTRIFFDGGIDRDELWITTRQVEFRESRDGTVIVHSRMKAGVTDFEHDSAYAFQLPLVGFTFDSAYMGLFEFQGWVKTPQDSYDRDKMRIPVGNPLDALEDPDNDDPEEGGAFMCDPCSYGYEAHPIIRYLPPADHDMYRKLYGRKVIIKCGYAPTEPED